jgi:amidase
MEKKDIMFKSALAATAVLLYGLLQFGREPEHSKGLDEERKIELAYSDAVVLVDMLQKGQITSSELLEIFIERIEKLDHIFNAVVVRDFENARSAARRADEYFIANKGMNLKPLHGLPMTVKEEMQVGGMPASCRGDALFYTKGKYDKESIEAIRRIQDAGAIIFGKTNVPKGCLDWQCYNKVYGNTINPFDKEVSPGGSSGGSAVALLCGFTPLEFGGDSAGSIR